jgi:hypothetical protein
MVQASLPPSPRFAFSGISTPVELDIEARLVADILALATLPVRSEIAADRFRQAQLRAAEETLRVESVVRRTLPRCGGACACCCTHGHTVRSRTCCQARVIFGLGLPPHLKLFIKSLCIEQ